MLDDLEPREPQPEGQAAPKSDARAIPEPPLTDREVPLNAAHTADAIHAWLDGEKVNPDQLHASEKEYTFWQRVEQEANRRRRMKTPSSLPGQIMRAIKKDE